MKSLFLILFLTTSLQAQVRGYILCEIPQNKKHVSLYINHIWQDCEEISKDYNIPLALIIAQCCLESGFGRSYQAQVKNNHLGIKIRGEYVCFDSFKDCLKVYAQTLSKACYKDFQPRTLLEWVESLKYECCTYATSPNYSKKLKSIIKAYNLDVIPYDYVNDNFVKYNK
jgi:flagellum-specific peptidoglycan hydrolase FlgJ